MLFNSKWITYKTGEYKSADDKYRNPSPYFRHVFHIDGDVKRATILASAMGVFKLYLNGEAISDDYLSPGWVDYRKKLPFVRYDITDKLADKNAIGVEWKKQKIRLPPEYESVKSDANDLPVIYIDDKEYDPDDKSSPKTRKAAEHRMTIECLLADIDTNHAAFINRIEDRLNSK